MSQLSMFETEPQHVQIDMFADTALDPITIRFVDADIILTIEGPWSHQAALSMNKNLRGISGVDTVKAINDNNWLVTFRRALLANDAKVQIREKAECFVSFWSQLPGQTSLF